VTITEVWDGNITAAGAQATEVDISGIDGDWTIKLQVESLTEAKKIILAFEDTVDDFSNSVIGPTVNTVGEISKTADKVWSWTYRNWPSLRFGTASAELRLNCLSIDAATTAHVRAWIEY